MTQKRRYSVGAVTLLLVLLLLSRFGAELFKLYAYADLLLSGGRMLIYSDVHTIDFHRSLKGEGPSVPENADVLNPNGTRIEYNGHIYELNKDLTTVLVMGVDRRSIQETTYAGTGGQADVVLLVALDTSTGESTVLNISRETYAQVQVFSTDGAYVDTRFEQLALAYGYGDGREKSCENTVRSVSYLLYMLPIKSYLSMDMETLIAANDALGGVKLKSLIDIEMPDGSSVKAGDEIELHGQNAEWYIRTRGRGLQSNERRMERQQQYITEFTKKAIARSKTDLSYPITLFSTLSPSIVTNLTIPDVTFLSSCFLKNGGSFSFRSIEGTFGLLNGSAVYYLDETDLFEAVLQVFYRQVE